MTVIPTTQFPVDFRDVHYLAITYPSSFTAVAAKLDGTGLKPGLVFNGKPLVAVGLINYKESDLGAYNEVIIAIPVIPDGVKSGLKNWTDLYAPFKKRKLGQYIIHIPVTSEISMDAGRKIWGYPKIVRKIDHDFQTGIIKSSIWNRESDKKIIEFKGASGMGLPIPSMDLMTYSFKDGHLIKTTVDTDANMKWKMNADIRINVMDESDPLCKDIIDLGLVNKKPLFTIEASKFKAKFNEGKII